MFVNNYIKYRSMMFSNTYYASTNFKNVEGTSCFADAEKSYTADFGTGMGYGFATPQKASTTVTSSNAFSSLSPGVYFGSGTTAPTKEDYSLETPITSGLLVSNATIRNGVTEDGAYFYMVTFVLYNSSDEAITVSEVGYFGETGYSKSSTYYRNLCMFDRTLLDAPVVIPAKETRAVTYKITFNQTQV